MNIHFINIKLYICIGLIIISALVPLRVMAIVYSYDRDFYSSNDIVFYEPEISPSNPVIPDSSTSNPNAPGSTNPNNPTDPNDPIGDGEEIDLSCYQANPSDSSGEVLRSIMLFYMNTAGLSSMQAAVIAGNFKAESAFNPYNINHKSGAYGIAQWYSADRRAGLFGSTTNKCPNLREQLNFSMVELNGGYSGTLALLKTLTNADDIEYHAMKFHRSYENSEETDAYARQVRGKYARDIYNSYLKSY